MQNINLNSPEGDCYDDREELEPLVEEIINIIVKEEISYFKALQVLEIAGEKLCNTTFPKRI